MNLDDNIKIVSLKETFIHGTLTSEYYVLKKMI
jgi:hypothetical protein